MVYIHQATQFLRVGTAHQCYWKWKSNNEICEVKSALEYCLRLMNRCKYSHRLVLFYTPVADDWVLMNSGTESR